MPVQSMGVLIAQYIALAGKIAVLVVLGFWGKQCFQKLSASLNQPPSLESSWGGLGGGLGGWKMSPSLTWLIMALLTTVLFAGVALQLSDGLVAPPKEEPKAADTTKASGGEVKAEPKAASSPAAAMHDGKAGENGAAQPAATKASQPDNSTAK